MKLQAYEIASESIVASRVSGWKHPVQRTKGAAYAIQESGLQSGHVKESFSSSLLHGLTSQHRTQVTVHDSHFGNRERIRSEESP